jgi:signal transduction histidine kinase
MVNRRQDGRLYEAALTAAPLTNPDRQIVGFVGVQRDITRQKELDRLKDQFVSNVSHELRTPLVNLKLYLSLLDRGQPEKRAEYMQTLHREQSRLDRMIEDLLDISRLDRQAAPVELAPIDLHQFLRVVEAIEDFWLTIVSLPPKGTR